MMPPDGMPCRCVAPVDPLEQTQEIHPERAQQEPEGVYRRHFDGQFYRAPDLSLRYPSIPIDMTRRQAC